MGTIALTHLWIKHTLIDGCIQTLVCLRKTPTTHIYSKASQGKKEWHIFQVVLWLKLNALVLWYSWVCTQWDHVDKIKSGEWQEWENSTWTCYLSDGCFANITRMILQELQLLVSDEFVFSIMHEKLTAAELEYCWNIARHHLPNIYNLLSTSQEARRKKKREKKPGSDSVAFWLSWYESLIK